MSWFPPTNKRSISIEPLVVISIQNKVDILSIGTIKTVPSFAPPFMCRVEILAKILSICTWLLLELSIVIAELSESRLLLGLDTLRFKKNVKI